MVLSIAVLHCTRSNIRPIHFLSYLSGTEPSLRHAKSFLEILNDVYNDIINSLTGLEVRTTRVDDVYLGLLYVLHGLVNSREKSKNYHVISTELDSLHCYRKLRFN